MGCRSWRQYSDIAEDVVVRSDIEVAYTPITTAGSAAVKADI
jgi:hypothetical protein